MVTKAEIIDTAFFLFAELGFHETSMENIANALGLKKQSLYSHYKSKNDIIISVLLDQTNKIQGELDNLISQHGRQPIEKLLKFFFIRLSVYFSNRERLLFWRRIALHAFQEDQKAALQTLQEFYDSFTGVISELLTERSAVFRNPESLRSFLDSFFITMQGQMDHILVFGFNCDTAERVWNNFWHGAEPIVYGEPDW